VARIPVDALLEGVEVGVGQEAVVLEAANDDAGVEAELGGEGADGVSGTEGSERGRAT
jgi:hypothetical protein